MSDIPDWRWLQCSGLLKLPEVPLVTLGESPVPGGPLGPESPVSIVSSESRMRLAASRDRPASPPGESG
jgi:hypothetical protein